MVNRGASQGCITCRQRRVKCDESKPQCKTCIRLGRECAGYGKKRLLIRFKNETDRLSGNSSDDPTKLVSSKNMGRMTAATTTTATQGRTTTDQLVFTKLLDSTVALPSPSIAQQDRALSFFLTYVTGIGRNLESTRGFMEFVRPALTAEKPDSALFAAVNAASAILWVSLRQSSSFISQPLHLHNKALLRLQKAIKDPKERRRDATVLAVLLLQAYETISAVLGHHKANGTHRDGALALLLHRSDESGASKYHGSLLGNILHSKVSLCIREKRSLSVHEVEWVHAELVPHVPVNPSTLLDIIGISIANLQHQFLRPSSFQEPMSHSELKESLRCVRTLDASLELWQHNLPSHWNPIRIENEDCLNSSDITYRGASDVYPTLQIANIWSVWRIYRLILLQIKLLLAREIRKLFGLDKQATPEDQSLNGILDYTKHILQSQNLLDCLCYSIPFYLGNRKLPAGLSDMENPNLTFPSYHDLQFTDHAFLSYFKSDCYVSRVDHDRHVLLHGALHIVSILAYHIGLLAETRTLQVSQIFGHEQKLWISKQFLRAAYLLRLIPEEYSLDARNYDGSDETRFGDNNFSNVEAVASTVRQKLWTVSIL